MEVQVLSSIRPAGSASRIARSSAGLDGCPSNPAADPFPFFRSFLVSACAFAGAGWFGYWLVSVSVSVSVSDWETGFWLVILAALIGGWLFVRFDRAEAGEPKVPSD